MPTRERQRMIVHGDSREEYGAKGIAGMRERGRDREITRWLGLAGVVGPIMFVLVFTIVGMARPGYSAVRQPVSDLGRGPNGWQLNVPLILLGLLLTTFVAGFFRAFGVGPGRVRRWVSAGLLELPGIGFAVAGAFPLPSPVHWIVGATLVFLGSVPAFIVTGLFLRRDPAWRGWGTYSLVTGVVTLALAVAMFVLANPNSPVPLQITGLIERILFVEMLAWYAAVGWRIFREASSESPPRAQPSAAPPRDRPNDSYPADQP